MTNSIVTSAKLKIFLDPETDTQALQRCCCCCCACSWCCC